MSINQRESGLGTNQPSSVLSDQDAAKIAQESYDRKRGEIVIEREEGDIVYNVVETIDDEETGLYGYVLENEKTGEIVISFEGTRMGEGAGPMITDWSENISSFLMGGSEYSEKENIVNYHGTKAQDAALLVGEAKINEDGKFVRINTNQFTEADEAIEPYIEEYGEDNITFVGHSLGGGLAEYFAVKYESHAVTFAAPDIYNLLTDEQQKQADNGEFQSNIISYAYPEDIVSEFNHHSIGSKYYLENPAGVSAGVSEKHKIANYLRDDMFDEKGYYIPNLLIDETLFGLTEWSPLALKNSGSSDFNILIKTAIMKAFVTDIEDNVTLIDNTEKSLKNFWDIYSSEMKELKREFESKVGLDEYNKLTSADVAEVLEDIGKIDKQAGVPLIFNEDKYEEVLERTRDLRLDTYEIAFHMRKMSEDFEETDRLLAQWLQF